MSAIETRRWLAATFLLVAAFGSTILAPARDACGAGLLAPAPRATCGVESHPDARQAMNDVARPVARLEDGAARQVRARALRLLELGEMGEARELAEVAVQLAPDDPAGHALVSSLRSACVTSAR